MGSLIGAMLWPEHLIFAAIVIWKRPPPRVCFIAAGVVALLSNTVAAVMNPMGWSGGLAPIIAPFIWALIAIAYRWFRMRPVSSP